MPRTSARIVRTNFTENLVYVTAYVFKNKEGSNYIFENHIHRIYCRQIHMHNGVNVYVLKLFKGVESLNKNLNRAPVKGNCAAAPCIIYAIPTPKFLVSQ